MASETASAFIWWSQDAGKRLPDGGFEQVLTLEASPMITIEKPEAWLRITTMSAFNQGTRERNIFWYKSNWSSSAPWTLIIHSSGYATADVFACVEIEGKPYFAQTRFILYGQAGENEKDREDQGPGWPEFTVRSNGEFYWPQTGHEFTLSLSNEITGDFLEVCNGQGKLLDEVHNSGGVYKYTAPHDPELNRAGVTAAKPLIFVAGIDEGGTATFTQMVHRSRYAFWSIKAGLTVFAAALLLSGLTVMLFRRRTRPCH